MKTLTLRNCNVAKSSPTRMKQTTQTPTSNTPKTNRIYTALQHDPRAHSAIYRAQRGLKPTHRKDADCDVLQSFAT